jgi:iron complex outermembrane recepter protein
MNSTRSRRFARVPMVVAALVAAAGQDLAGAAEEGGMEEVIVTAQRREENLQKAALAVSAIAGETLTQQSVTQAVDLTRLFPALQIAPASSLTQIYLRGVGTFGANAFAEQGVAFNLDGAYLSRPAAPAALFYDLERIEVLKGPQGTLYGRNATGGAMNVITAKPKLGVTEGYVNAELGNYSAVKTSAAVNLATGERSALRFAGQYAARGGYFNDGYDDEDTKALRGQYRFDGDSVDVTAMIDYGHVGGQGIGGTIMPLLAGNRRLGPSDPAVIAAYVARPPTPPVPQIRARADGYQSNDYFGALATIDWDLGFATATFVPAYRKTDLDFLNYSGSFAIDVIEKSEQTSFEARLANQGDRLKWVLGAYWFDEQVSADQAFDQASNGTRINSALDTTSYALFGEGTWSFTDRFRGTLGLRYTTDNKRQDTLARTLPFVGFVPPGPPNFVPIILDIPTTATTDVDFSETTWKVGFEYDLAPQSLLYGTVATGFKSGILYSAVGRNYSDPESVTAYTLGSKNRFAGNRLQLNVEAFRWDYKDQQISRLGPVQVAATPAGPVFGPVFLTSNAGAATIQGVETELLWQVSPAGLLSLNVQYLDATYDELRYQAYSVSGATPAINCPITGTNLTGASAAARIFDVDCSGRPLVNAPDWTVNLGYEHRFDLGARGALTLGVDTRMESSRALSLDYLALSTQDDYRMSNARLGWEPASGRYTVTAFVNNLEDELVFSNSLQSPAKAGVVYNQLRPPRTYGLRASVRF